MARMKKNYNLTFIPGVSEKLLLKRAYRSLLCEKHLSNDCLPLVSKENFIKSAKRGTLKAQF